MIAAVDIAADGGGAVDAIAFCMRRPLWLAIQMHNVQERQKPLV
jgi:hypothetical protein